MQQLCFFAWGELYAKFPSVKTMMTLTELPDLPDLKTWKVSINAIDMLALMGIL
jgi:hypothetical protein